MVQARIYTHKGQFYNTIILPGDTFPPYVRFVHKKPALIRMESGEPSEDDKIWLEQPDVKLVEARRVTGNYYILDQELE